MRIYLVCSTKEAWMSCGYGGALLAGDASKLLVSFVEFIKDPKQQLAVTDMPNPYIPKLKELPNEDLRGFGNGGDSLGESSSDG